MGRFVGEIRKKDLVHGLPVGPVGHVDRALYDVFHAPACLFDQRTDIVEAVLRLHAHVADGKAAFAVAPDAADEHEPTGDGGLGERQPAAKNPV